jgi:hypothetical protein
MQKLHISKWNHFNDQNGYPENLINIANEALTSKWREKSNTKQQAHKMRQQNCFTIMKNTFCVKCCVLELTP